MTKIKKESEFMKELGNMLKSSNDELISAQFRYFNLRR